MSTTERGAKGFKITTSVEGPTSGRVIIEWGPEVSGNLEFQKAFMQNGWAASELATRIALSRGTICPTAFSILFGLLVRYFTSAKIWRDQP